MPDEQGYMSVCGGTAGEMEAWEHQSGEGGRGWEDTARDGHWVRGETSGN